ncbi:protein YLS9-like [Panicum miliaceum]|uniref:Protein YLS9-like n=1 Tax=Panicum miliaceum TaxID=4540 RepID=A0A3L6SIT8_PANMI|nr:protein YLS9-like [Panicum miliaceum]
MAAYEKQQPQPQPTLNAGYYGPPIPPPQPAYYPPPPAPHRGGGGPRCLLCFLFKVVALAVIALGAATLVLWLIYRPDAPKAYADSAALSRFDLGAGAGGDLLQYNLTVAIRLRNPNRFGIRYEYAEAQALYDDERFGFDPLQPFYLGGKSDARVTAAFSGSAAVGGDDDVRRTYRRENGEGFYYVKVRVYSDLSFRVRVFRVHYYKSKITCVLRLPAPAAGGNANATAMTTLGTRCDVNF